MLNAITRFCQSFPNLIGLASILILMGLSNSRVTSLQDDVCTLQMELQEFQKKSQQGIQLKTFEECLDRLNNR